MSAGKKNEAARLFAEGLALQQAGRLSEARQCYERGLKYHPGNPDALFLLGQVLFDSGETAVGERKMRAAIDARPQAANYRGGLAISLFNAGRLADAAREFARAVRTLSGDATLWRGFAMSAAQTGDLAVALNAATQWLALQPADADAASLRNRLGAQIHYEQGVALAATGNDEEACVAYTEALRYDPTALPILTNLANLYAAMGRGDEAGTLYAKALSLDAGYAPAHFNVGMLHLDAGRRLDAAQSFEAAARCDPENGLIAAHLLFQKMHLCRWDGLDELARRIRAAIESNTADIPPFIVLSMPGTTPELQRRCAENHSNWLSTGEVPAIHRHPGEGDGPECRHGSTLESGFRRTDGKRRLRVGYLSSDFKNHATAYLMIDMLEAHDRSRFEVFGLSYGIDDHSAMRARVVASVEHFVELAGLPGREVVQRIADLNLDVLIDLKGYTEGNHSEWLQYRLAPVQINWLGFPGTLGAPWVDYLIADEVVAPSANQGMYSERLLHLPGSYQPNCRVRQAASMPVPTRAEEALPDEAIVLCSFNQTYKITPALFAVWLNVLREVPATVLWLWASNPWAETELRRAAEAAGVAAARLVFAEGRPQEAHLARLPLADLALDTFPCNGHTTSSDALWAGVPVVTLQGETFAARVASSLLTASGLEQLIATSTDAYRQIVVDFCRDGEMRGRLKSVARRLREESALFDGAAFADKLETVLLDAVSRRNL